MRIRAAVVGLGFGRGFAAILKDHPECELLCVADLNEDVAAEVARQLQVKHVARTLDEVLAMKEVDAVAIFTHAPRHAEHSIAALNAGKHVLCAVPAAITIEECEMLIEAVERTGLVYANAETSFFRPDAAQCRKWYQEGRFGKIVYMEAEYLHDYGPEGLGAMSPKEYKGQHWRFGFPPFLYITHSTGFLLGITGKRLVEVTAYPVEIPGDDVFRSDTYWQCPFGNAVALFKTNDGIPVRIMEMRRVAYDVVEKFSIYGEKMSFISPRHESWESSYCIFERRQDGTVGPPSAFHPSRLHSPLPDPLVKYTYGGHGGSHPYIVEDWIRSIVDGRMPCVNVYEAVAFCAPGIVAHKSCLGNGERLRIPQFDKGVHSEGGS
jgi:predicted dehydrogenase